METSKMFDLSGKNAIIFGGAGGLGKLVAKSFAEAGAKVAIASRGEEKLVAACTELKEQTGKDFYYYVCDATNEEQVKECAAKANAEMGPVTILVNSQGINKKLPVFDFPIEDFNNVMNANVTSILITAKHFAPYMKKAGYGKIVNVSSVRGKIATRGPGNAAYCSSKGAEDMLTKVLAAELGPYNICVNAFGPNIMKTPMMTKVFEMRAKEAGITVDEYLKQQAAGLPLRRMSDPDDCVGTALFLASPASDFLTGNVLYPDGGLTAVG
ncbi:MAG: SDR family oxidoreductase [Oscillospiraceae bacterium]|nr:SDR family oxidoreductase [Oscillospiraceae bacterium]